jgi:hypothetical protein
LIQNVGEMLYVVTLLVCGLSMGLLHREYQGVYVLLLSSSGIFLLALVLISVWISAGTGIVT